MTNEGEDSIDGRCPNGQLDGKPQDLQQRCLWLPFVKVIRKHIRTYTYIISYMIYTIYTIIYMCIRIFYVRMYTENICICKVL